MSTSAPPAGTASQQRVHRFGFLRDGLNPATARMRPPTPPKGLLQPALRRRGQVAKHAPHSEQRGVTVY